MLHYVFWFLLAVCGALAFLGVPRVLCALMFIASGAIGIAALGWEARHPDHKSTGTAAAVSLALLLGVTAILLAFLEVATGTIGIIDAIFAIVGALLCLLELYALLCQRFRSLPALPAPLLELTFLGDERK